MDRSCGQLWRAVPVIQILTEPHQLWMRTVQWWKCMWADVSSASQMMFWMCVAVLIVHKRNSGAPIWQIYHLKTLLHGPRFELDDRNVPLFMILVCNTHVDKILCLARSMITNRHSNLNYKFYIRVKFLWVTFLAVLFNDYKVTLKRLKKKKVSLLCHLAFDELWGLAFQTIAYCV